MKGKSMIIRFLQDLFSKTVGNKQQEPTFTPPVENSAKESVSESEDKFKSDVAILSKRYGELQNLQIEVTLQKLLTIVPRRRQRIDAYRSLVGYLKKTYNCTLIINSRKHGKGNNY